jgi:hypothetical protein
MSEVGRISPVAKGNYRPKPAIQIVLIDGKQKLESV